MSLVHKIIDDVRFARLIQHPGFPTEGMLLASGPLAGGGGGTSSMKAVGNAGQQEMGKRAQGQLQGRGKGGTWNNQCHEKS